MRATKRCFTRNSRISAGGALSYFYSKCASDAHINTGVHRKIYNQLQPEVIR